VIIAFATEALDLQTFCTFNVTDTAGLVYAARSGIVFSSDGREQIREFYARSANALSSDVVTETISGCGTNYNNIMVFGISGANYNTPFDPNTSLPGTGSGTGRNTSVQISTSNTRDLVFAGVLHGNVSAYPSAQTGFTIITPPGTNAVEYQTVNSTITGSTVSFIDTANGPWISIADAVAALSTDFGVSATPNTLSLQAGSVGTSTITATSSGNFSGIVTLSGASNPAGLGLTFSPASISVPLAGSASSTLTVSTTNTTVTGSYNVTVTGTSGRIVTAILIQVNVVSQVTSQLAVDGSAVAGCSNTTSTCSVSVTTQHGEDIIIAFPAETLDLQTSCAFNISDTIGLAWAARSGIVYGRGGRDELQEFWARSLNPLSSDEITESIIGCGDNYNSLMVFAISGANFNNPFDPNLSLPATASSISGNTSVYVSTSNPTDMIFSGLFHGSLSSPTAGSGFTIVTSVGTMGTEYQITGSAKTDEPVAFNDSATDYWEQIADAVQSGITTPDFTLFTSPNSLTLTPASTGTSTLTVSSLNGFSGSVALTTRSPAGIGATIAPSTVTAPGTATITITTNSTGTFTIQITGTSGTLTHSASLAVIVAGVVCIIPYGGSTCPSVSASIGGEGQSQVRVSVFTQGSGGLSGFDVILLADHSILRPAGVDLTATVLLGTPSILSECLGGVLVRGASCSSQDTADTLELAATSAAGQPNTPTPTTGLLFTAIYNITGATNGISLGFQSGCGSSSSPTSDTPYCVDVANGSPAPVLESVESATFSESQSLTTSFNGVTFQVTSNLVNQTSTSQLIGTIQVTGTNSTGQTVFTSSYSIQLSYPITGPMNPYPMLRFVLLVTSLRDAVLCSVNPPTAPLIHCFATYNPDVYNQGQVNIIDAAALAQAYGSTPGSPYWNPYFDFDLTGSIDIQDVSIVFFYYGAALIA
jgi:hypothetical protein